MKKVIDSHGNELEIGNVYEFSNDKIDWYVAEFKKVSDCGSEYLSERFGWKLFIRECQSPLGTIKKAPVNLVDGKAYQFEMLGDIYCGFFSITDDCFRISTDGESGVVGYLSKCTNIIGLQQETK